jgi:hypothetical protein
VEVHKKVFGGCEFCEYQRTKGFTSLRGVNEFLSVLSTFVYDLVEIWRQRAAHNDAEIL